jgi:2-polyprenyl-3-methyl-5-hydroxy-6-metoxy-1,4-benzoquinol methylase
MDKRLENEIEHGKFLAEHGAGEIWNWEGEAGRRRWSRRVKMLTSHLKNGMNVLEIGCGTGYFTKELQKTGASIISIDISPELLEIAKKEIQSPNVSFTIENAYELSFQNESFDTIIGSSVLHHLEIDKALKEFFRVLKSGGSIYFTEPNMLNPQIAIQKNIPWVKRKLGDSPDETAFFKWGIKNKLIQYGFTNVSITPFDFLHPKIPDSFVTSLDSFCKSLETIPIIKEISGSLHIKANKK